MNIQRLKYKRCNINLWPSQWIINQREIYNSSPLAARSGDVGNTNYKLKGKKSRQDRIDKKNMESHTKLYYIDNEFKIFNQNIKKVLDLGYVPGNWSQYAKFKLCQVHGLEEEDFHKKCCLLGFDLLFGSSIKGISTIQGNIYSKMSHQHIIEHFKGLSKLTDFDTKKKNEEESYFIKETNIEEELHELNGEINNLTLKGQLKNQFNNTISNPLKYNNNPNIFGPDLILSDLGIPFLQSSGFFNNSSTRPYMRFNSNKALQKPITEGPKSSLDLADASLLLTCNILKSGGTFIIRLPEVDLNDPEVDLYKHKLEMVFNMVSIWNKDGKEIGKPDSKPNINEIFFVCKEKKMDNEFNTSSIF